MTNIEGELMQQIQPAIDKAVNEKLQEIITVVQARWGDRVSRRISEAQWAVRQGRIYDPENALMKTYDAYRWVADHVELGVDIQRNETGAEITLMAHANDDSEIDDFRKARIAECVDDLTKQVNYDYF